MQGSKAQLFTIEVSTNLATWALWKTIEADAQGFYLLRPTNSVQQPYQFYRVSRSE
jgi:hypothetical protein